MVTFLSLWQHCLCISLFSILISSNAKLESSSRKQHGTEGRSMYINIAPQGHRSQGWILTSTSSRSWIVAAGVGGHFASSSPVLDPASGNCTWSLSKSCQAQPLKREVPQCSGLTQCVFCPRSQEIGCFLSWLLGSAGGLSHLWNGNLYECLPPGLEGEYKVPWMLSNKKRRMPSKSPVHFSRLPLRVLLHLQPLIAVVSSCLRLRSFEKHTHTFSLSLLLLINTKGQLSSLHKATAIPELLEGLLRSLSTRSFSSFQQPTLWTLTAHYCLHRWRSKTRPSPVPLLTFPRKTWNLSNVIHCRLSLQRFLAQQNPSCNLCL